MVRILPTYRKLLSSFAVALPVFALSFAVAPAPDGGFGVIVAEAKGKGGKSSAKGQRGGQQKLVKTERSGGKRNAKSDRDHGRVSKTEDRRQERQARQETRERHDGLDHRRDRQGDQDRGDDRDRSQRHDQEVASNSDEYDHVEPRNWGATSSQLKHRNAARASESAFQNASPNSNVGRISTYRDAARATLDKERDIDLLDRDIADLQRERDLAIAEGRFADAEAADQDILRLEDERFLAEGDLDDLLFSEREAYDSVGGPELNEHDYRVFRSMLGLE
jgi:hypothetical protein